MKEAFKNFFKVIGKSWYAAATACMAAETYNTAYARGDWIWVIGGWVMMILALCMIFNEIDQEYKSRVEKLEATVYRLKEDAAERAKEEIK